MTGIAGAVRSGLALVAAIVLAAAAFWAGTRTTRPPTRVPAVASTTAAATESGPERTVATSTSEPAAAVAAEPPPVPVDPAVADELALVEAAVFLTGAQRSEVAALLAERRRALDTIQARIRAHPDTPWDTAAVSREAAAADRACWDGVRRLLSREQRAPFERGLAAREFGAYAIEIPRPTE